MLIARWRLPGAGRPVNGFDTRGWRCAVVEALRTACKIAEVRPAKKLTSISVDVSEFNSNNDAQDYVFPRRSERSRVSGMGGEWNMRDIAIASPLHRWDMYVRM